MKDDFLKKAIRNCLSQKWLSREKSFLRLNQSIFQINIRRIMFSPKTYKKKHFFSKLGPKYCWNNFWDWNQYNQQQTSVHNHIKNQCTTHTHSHHSNQHLFTTMSIWKPLPTLNHNHVGPLAPTGLCHHWEHWKAASLKPLIVLQERERVFGFDLNPKTYKILKNEWIRFWSLILLIYKNVTVFFKNKKHKYFMFVFIEVSFLIINIILVKYVNKCNGAIQ